MKRKGMQSFELKQRREIRRRNHIALDLHSPKYRPRIKERKMDEEQYEMDFSDWEDGYDPYNFEVETKDGIRD